MDQKILTKKEVEILKEMDITSIEQLITHYPFRYEKVEIKPYREWMIEDKIYIEARVISTISLLRKGKLAIGRFDVLSEDEVFHITIFNRPWIKSLKLNSMITIFGKYDGNRKITALKYNLRPLYEQLGITPVYNLKNKITQASFINIMKKTLKHNHFYDLIPESLKVKYKLIDRHDALTKIHFPNNDNDIKIATRYLKYEEFLKLQLIIISRRQQFTINDLRYKKIFNVDEVFRLVNNLPFILTNDQLKAVNDIIADLNDDKPMYRLIQGDVGCGKTIVAAIGIYACYLSGYQIAFMAPTEVLVKQQFAELKQIFKHTNMKIGLLYSAMNLTDKKDTLDDLYNDKIDLIVGTHALIQNDVKFSKLGMIITDEQHRFGVNQRRKLIDKGDFVDILVMSATPIPRTLTNVIYNDMDVSNIYTLPVGRKPVITKLIKENSIKSFISEILIKIDQGAMCYVVCPAISEDNDLGVRNTTSIFKALKKELNDRYAIGMLHGKMDSSQKEKVIQQFKEGKTQILVTTTVVEVGVNIKAANLMVIYNADRFGLSTLHQLRGRIKRSDKQGYCYLLSETQDEQSLQRLQVLVDSDDGFQIAEDDLRLRGPGDLFGTRQSGLPSLNLGNMITDAKIIQVAKQDAYTILSNKNADNKEIRLYIDDFLKSNDFID
ncbi:MAG: ATP-dependent DNA helicase RecG [Erysipelotrichaceae bacterium]|nr:ATP-dependent DNA helicase RecG [Erysipelotrichaceae bacterium]MDD3924351.1 ATP-dependent DNA helicase RecG [Erysipelotrichaceae bacterium]MDD4642199.1 ATP-dependent DNA helicase RecG [Erysipelotrichaceae bacterium]